jgi:hypothetical protein
MTAHGLIKMGQPALDAIATAATAPNSAPTSPPTREFSRLAYSKLSDIGLVDLAVDFHVPQVIRDLEQCLGFEADGDGLSWIDFAVDDDATNGARSIVRSRSRRA